MGWWDDLVHMMRGNRTPGRQMIAQNRADRAAGRVPAWAGGNAPYVHPAPQPTTLATAPRPNAWAAPTPPPAATPSTVVQDDALDPKSDSSDASWGLTDDDRRAWEQEVNAFEASERDRGLMSGTDPRITRELHDMEAERAHQDLIDYRPDEGQDLPLLQEPSVAPQGVYSRADPNRFADSNWDWTPPSGGAPLARTPENSSDDELGDFDEGNGVPRNWYTNTVPPEGATPAQLAHEAEGRANAYTTRYDDPNLAARLGMRPEELRYGSHPSLVGPNGESARAYTDRLNRADDNRPEGIYAATRRPGITSQVRGEDLTAGIPQDMLESAPASGVYAQAYPTGGSLLTYANAPEGLNEYLTGPNQFKTTGHRGPGSEPVGYMKPIVGSSTFYRVNGNPGFDEDEYSARFGAVGNTDERGDIIPPGAAPGRLSHAETEAASPVGPIGRTSPMRPPVAPSPSAVPISQQSFPLEDYPDDFYNISPDPDTLIPQPAPTWRDTVSNWFQPSSRTPGNIPDETPHSAWSDDPDDFSLVTEDAPQRSLWQRFQSMHPWGTRRPGSTFGQRWLGIANTNPGPAQPVPAPQAEAEAVPQGGGMASMLPWAAMYAVNAMQPKPPGPGVQVIGSTGSSAPTPLVEDENKRPNSWM